MAAKAKIFFIFSLIIACAFFAVSLNWKRSAQGTGTLYMNDTVTIRQMELGPMQNFVYLIGCPRSKEAAVVDRAWNVDAICEAVKREGWTIKAVLITHPHFDHVNGVEAIVKKTNALVYVNKNDASALEAPSDRIRAVGDGDVLTMGDVSIRFMHTPGHSPGAQCLIVGNYVLTGDTLFIEGCGRTDLAGGDSRALYESLNHKIRAWDDGLIVLPGHNYGSIPSCTLGEQKKSNFCLRCRNLESFLAGIGEGE